jgi:hypothetical protein
VVGDASVTDASGILARRRVLHGTNKNLYRILACSNVDDFKSVLNQVYGSRLLAGAAARTHKIVYEPFNYADFSLVKLSMLMSAHAVGNMHGFKRYVLLEPRVI